MVLCCTGLPQAQPLSALGVLLFVVFSGLTIRGEDMPSYWIWLYWVRHTSTFQTLARKGENEGRVSARVEPGQWHLLIHLLDTSDRGHNCAAMVV
jgi:hypothetical protein